MQGGSAVAAVFRAHRRVHHDEPDCPRSHPTSTAAAPISASNSRRLRARPITVSPSPCLASEKSACLSFSTRVNSPELHEKPAFPIFFIFGLTRLYRCIYTQRHAAVPSRSHFSCLSRLRLLETAAG